jgi:hypothetical protein
MMRRELGILLLTLLACRRDVASKDKDAAASTTCASIVASYDALASAGGACTTEADCACFNGGVSPAHACGGVTTRAIVPKLDALAQDFDANRCGSLMCAAWMCAPACIAGRCENGGAR